LLVIALNLNLSLIQGLQALTDLKINLSIEERGQVVEAKILNEESLPPGLRGNMEQMLRTSKEMFIGWPEEELGIGARFILVTPEFSVGGLSTRSKVLYKITDISENKVNLQVVTQNTFPEQILDGESFGGAEMAGAKVKIFPETSYNQGTLNWYFDRMLPTIQISGASNVTMEMSDIPGMEEGSNNADGNVNANRNFHGVE
jgi:hypothetical protein